MVATIRASGGTAGVVVAPCPFFYPDASTCWGGATGRYHQWYTNVSRTCSGNTTRPCPFDAIVAHNYVTDVDIFRSFPSTQWLSVLLAVPQVTIANGVHRLLRDFPGTKLLMTEYNVFYPSVWYGAADGTDAPIARFLNATENSGAHAVFVAAHVVAAASHDGIVDMAHYHSFLGTWLRG